MKFELLAASPSGLLVLAAFVASTAWRLRPQAEVPAPLAALPVVGLCDNEPPLRDLRATPGIGDTLAKRLLDARWRVPAAERSAAAVTVEGLGPRRLAALAERRMFPEDAAAEE